MVCGMRQAEWCRGVFKMKSARRQERAAASRLSRNEQVRREMQSFLRALQSYPERFLKDPGISFEEHCGELIMREKIYSRRSA
jgi:hypothetical protein